MAAGTLDLVNGGRIHRRDDSCDNVGVVELVNGGFDLDAGEWFWENLGGAGAV
jgi:hypothetical protein